MSDQTKYTSKLSKTRVLVIGGSSGIGFGVAQALLEHDADAVVISSSNPSRIDAAIEKLQKAYSSRAGRVSGFPADLGDEQALEANIARLLDQATDGGKLKLDHIVYTAGDALAARPASEMSLADIKQAGMVRFFSPIALAKVAPKYLNEGPASSLVLTTGMVSEKPIPGWAIVNGYATGLHGVVRGFALDLQPIRVNLVSPGAVQTELWDAMPAGQREALMKNMAEHTTTKLIGQVEDVAEAYIYLMKDKNMSGACISTNGGGLLV